MPKTPWADRYRAAPTNKSNVMRTIILEEMCIRDSIHSSGLIQAQVGVQGLGADLLGVRGIGGGSIGADLLGAVLPQMCIRDRINVATIGYRSDYRSCGCGD